MTDLIPNDLPQIDRLKRLMKALRDPETGCPWDLQQSYETIVPHTIEETYEVVEAIENKDFPHLKEELGDLLFQVIFYAQLAEEDGHFDFDQIIQTLVDKMIYRHPHVFDQNALKTAKDVEKQWDDLKKAAKLSSEASQPFLMETVPTTLPALNHAYKLQQKAAKIGFDFETISQSFDKVYEEVAEAKAELKEHDTDLEKLTDELGDILFAVTNVIRKAGQTPDTVLRKTNRKFIDRFNYIERQAREQQKDLTDFSLEEMEKYWVEAKKQ